MSDNDIDKFSAIHWEQENDRPYECCGKDIKMFFKQLAFAAGGFSQRAGA